ncbi:hypothetical protein SADUNF_Sadunf10G0077600 [Salix dunnii]|uniref:Uncharacterized protein n=1 Tax=Salix dunnii TaxID=1413687 RepID=A0A835MUI0_9ROSI|nr:hypothetical protein SADUNF_Sadunf10G0077600 [Salix dunnii]
MTLPLLPSDLAGGGCDGDDAAAAEVAYSAARFRRGETMPYGSWTKSLAKGVGDTNLLVVQGIHVASRGEGNSMSAPDGVVLGWINNKRHNLHNEATYDSHPKPLIMYNNRKRFPHTWRAKIVTIPTAAPSERAMMIITQIAKRAPCGRPAPSSFDTLVLGLREVKHHQTRSSEFKTQNGMIFCRREEGFNLIDSKGTR